MEEQTQISENFEIPSRRRNFSAYLLDLLINITGIGFFINIIIILFKKNTLGNSLLGIKSIDNNNNQLSLGKSLLRYCIFYSTLITTIFIIRILVYYFFSLTPTLCNNYDYQTNNNFCSIVYTTRKIFYIAYTIALIPFLLNIVELFFKSPTFIDKRLGIKRIYKKSK